MQRSRPVFQLVELKKFRNRLNKLKLARQKDLKGDGRPGPWCSSQKKRRGGDDVGLIERQTSIKTEIMNMVWSSFLDSRTRDKGENGCKRDEKYHPRIAAFVNVIDTLEKNLDEKVKSTAHILLLFAVKSEIEENYSWVGRKQSEFSIYHSSSAKAKRRTRR
eukprot:IDg16078t1